MIKKKKKIKKIEVNLHKLSRVPDIGKNLPKNILFEAYAFLLVNQMWGDLTDSDNWADSEVEEEEEKDEVKEAREDMGLTIFMNKLQKTTCDRYDSHKFCTFCDLPHFFCTVFIFSLQKVDTGTT